MFPSFLGPWRTSKVFLRELHRFPANSGLRQKKKRGIEASEPFSAASELSTAEVNAEAEQAEESEEIEPTEEESAVEENDSETNQVWREETPRNIVVREQREEE